ncbi:MAG: hypothetical protein ACTSQ8_20695 [Candidatus Helarchaeota archaeon]
MGLGLSPGVVTCAIEYFDKAVQSHDPELQNFLRGSGGITHDEEGRGKIQELVIFSSEQVIREGKKNKLGEPVREEIEKLLNDVWTQRPKKARVNWVIVDINNYKDCLEKTIKMLYYFVPPGKQGKEIWMNMTGGSNAINLAFVTAARLTGLVSRLYIISQTTDSVQEKKLPLQMKKICPNKDGYLYTLPNLRTRIDEYLLFVLDYVDRQPGQKARLEEIYANLQEKFKGVEFDERIFLRQYILRYIGSGYLEQIKENPDDIHEQPEWVKLAPEGEQYLYDLQNLENQEELLGMLRSGTSDDYRKKIELSGWLEIVRL